MFLECSLSSVVVPSSTKEHLTRTERTPKLSPRGLLEISRYRTRTSLDSNSPLKLVSK